MGWHLAGVARAWAWAALYAWVASRSTSQAQTVDAPRDRAATVKPLIPHARSACVQGACASLASPVLQTRPDGAIRILTTAVSDPWNSWVPSHWGKIGLISAQT